MIVNGEDILKKLDELDNGDIGCIGDGDCDACDDACGTEDDWCDTGIGPCGMDGL